MPPEGPLVTIGMPSYNKAEYLAEAIESILAQTHSNLELLISDDRSTDESAAIAQTFVERDERVRFVSQPQNLGMIANFDYVLNHARGEDFMWFSSDDRVDPQWIENCLVARGEDGAIGFGRIQDVRRDGSVKRQYPLSSLEGSRLGRIVRLYWSIVPECNMLHGVTRTERVRTRGGLTPYAFAGQTFDYLYVFESALDGPLRSMDGAWLSKRDSLNNGVVQGGSSRALLVNALWPALPIRRVLLLHKARLPLGYRLALASMFVPRCALALFEWYGKGLELLITRLASRKEAA